VVEPVTWLLLGSGYFCASAVTWLLLGSKIYRKPPQFLR